MKNLRFAVVFFQLSDSGIYTCVAASSSGETSWSAFLEVKGTSYDHLLFIDLRLLFLVGMVFHTHAAYSALHLADTSHGTRIIRANRLDLLLYHIITNLLELRKQRPSVTLMLASVGAR